jgi:hypothetical protein
MDILIGVVATFVIGGALGAFGTLIVSRIMGVKFRPSTFVSAFVVWAILGLAAATFVVLHVVQRQINANF